MTQSKRTSRHVLYWTVEHVIKWLHKYASPEGPKYAALFEEHEINGLCLRMMTDEWLIRIGVLNQSDRAALMGHIYRMRLKYDFLDISNMQSV